MELTDLLRTALKHGASDIHLVPERPPFLRINGEMLPLKTDTLSSEAIQQMVFCHLSETLVEQFNQEMDLDTGLTANGIGRFRLNLLHQVDGVGAVLRVISPDIPTPEALCIEQVLLDLTLAPRGLILLTGPTGCGKTTTLACLINVINGTRKRHILTIEDPIEYLYPRLSSVVTQREVGTHAPTFGTSIRRAMRQDPDIILLGEMRDLETAGAALTLAETGHLVFGTMHTADAAQAVDRMIDLYPSYQQGQVRLQLSLILKAVVCQQLLPRADRQGMIAAREILVVNAAVANIIRQGNAHEIYSVMETNVQSGMKTLERDLSRLVHEGVVTYEAAIARANKIDLVRRRSNRG